MTGRSAATIGIAALLAGGLVLAAVALRPSSPRRRLPAPVPFAAQAPRYEVLYHVDHLAAGSSSRTWELLTVDRPFRVRDANFPASPAAGDRPASGTLTTPDRLYALTPAGIQDVSARQPGLGTQDQDLLGVVAEAARRRLAEDRGPDTAAGRTCRVYRFREPPTGPLLPLGNSEHDDVCIDPAGVVLREAWVRGGSLVLSREAERVDLDPAGLDATLSPAGALPPLADAASATPVAPGGPGATYLPDPPPPSGFTLGAVERFSFPAPDVPHTFVYSSVVWTFARGADVVTVEAAEGRPDLSPAPTNSRVTTLELPGLGRAYSAVRSDGFEIGALLRPGRWVRIRATAPLEEMEAYARGVSGPNG